MGRRINQVDRTLSITVLKFSDVYNTKRYFIEIYNITTVTYIYIYIVISRARVLRNVFSKFIMEYCKWCKFTVLIRILINIICQRDSILLTAALIVPCNLNFSITLNSFCAFVSQHRWNLYNSHAITLFHDYLQLYYFDKNFIPDHTILALLLNV